MSRWLWALLGGVILVAIAAFYWTASNPTNLAPQFPQSQRYHPTRASDRTAQEAAPSPPPSPAPPPAQEAAAPPPPAPTPPPPPSRSDCAARCGTASRLAVARAAPRDALSSARRRPGASTCSRSAGRTSPAASRARTGVGGSRGHLRAQEPCAAGRDLGLFRGGL